MSKIKHLSACDGCGELVEIPKVDLQHQYSCPRCQNVLYRPGERFLTIILMALSTLFLIIPAVTFPIISLQILGVQRDMNLIQTALFFLDDTYIGVGFIVLVSGIIFPIVSLLLLLYILISFRIHKKYNLIKSAYILYIRLQDWNFIDVYLLAIFISMIKLEKMGDLVVDVGLISFFLAMLFYTFTIYFFNPKDIWYAKELHND